MEDREPMQYKTPFRCVECGEPYFQTDAVLRSEMDFVDAECTSCGHALTGEEIRGQMAGIPREAIEKVVAQYRK